jgi:hypothetical protein
MSRLGIRIKFRVSGADPSKTRAKCEDITRVALNLIKPPNLLAQQT